MARRSMEIEEEILSEEAIQKKEESPAKVETSRNQIIRTGVVVNTSYVNVRKAANPEADVLEILRGGDKVAIIGDSKDFYKVKTSTNPVAYISSDFLKEE